MSKFEELQAKLKEVQASMLQVIILAKEAEAEIDYNAPYGLKLAEFLAGFHKKSNPNSFQLLATNISQLPHLIEYGKILMDWNAKSNPSNHCEGTGLVEKLS